MEEQAKDISSQLKDLKILEEYISKRVKEQIKANSTDTYESSSTDKICGALALAQGSFHAINTNRTNNFLFNQYSDLDVIMSAVRPALKENGLSITQQTKIEDDKTMLVTRVRHDSSQFIETRARIIPSKNDVQTYASALKAMRRHSIMALLNITIKDDLDDDDGERDMEEVRKTRNKGTSTNARYRAKQESFETISQGQENELLLVIGENIDIAEDILETLKIQSFADMPKSKYDGIKRQAQGVVNSRNGKPGF